MDNKPENANDLLIPSFLVCPPYKNSFSNKQPNNPLMTGKEKIDYNEAFKQWLVLYRFLSQNSLVYILMNEGYYQDQIYTANIGIVLTHGKTPVFVGSNFTSPPRQGEENVGLKFFEYMHYESIKCPYKFEGEADLKFVRNNTYIGGYGIRSELKSFHWMEEKYDCDIITVKMTDPKLYHEDCLVFPVNDEQVLVTVSKLQREDIKKLEKKVNIVEIPEQFAYEGMTNLARLKNYLLCRKVGNQQKMFMDNLCRKLSLTPVYFDLNQFDSSGADLSCCILHVNKTLYKSKNVDTLGKQVSLFFS